MNVAQDSKGKLSKVFLAVALTSYFKMIAGIAFDSPVSSILSEMDIEVGTAFFLALPLFAVIETFLMCWIPCTVMLKAKDDNSRISRVVIASIALVIITLISTGMTFSALISALYSVLTCVVLPYLYFFSYPTYGNTSLKTRFFQTMLILFLVGCLETTMQIGSLNFRDGYDMLIFVAFVVSILINFYLIPFIFVLFARAEQKMPMAIGLTLAIWLIDLLSGESFFMSLADAIMYVALPCYYIFGWFGSKAEDTAPSTQYRSFESEAPRPTQSATRKSQDASQGMENIAEGLYFTVLGPSGAGKTTLLACMYNEFEEMRSGMLVPDGQTSRILERAYTKLKNAANSPDQEFGTAIESTENKREYRFDIKGKGLTLPVRFYDFPGGWMDPDNENYEKEVMPIMRKSKAILVAVNTPYLMEDNGLYADEGLSSFTVQNIITRSYEGGDKLILLIPIKCEKYTRTPEDTRQMRERMKEKGIFKSTIGLLKNPTYEDMSMAIMPIHTVGNAEFKEFRKDGNGKIIGEVYAKTQGTSFNPRDTDQPLRFVMSFLLKEFAKENTLPGGLVDLGDFIRQGMRLDNPNFEIIGGRDKLA